MAQFAYIWSKTKINAFNGFHSTKNLTLDSFSHVFYFTAILINTF